jgi:hypothetical protein
VGIIHANRQKKLEVLCLAMINNKQAVEHYLCSTNLINTFLVLPYVLLCRIIIRSLIALFYIIDQDRLCELPIGTFEYIGGQFKMLEH